MSLRAKQVGGWSTAIVVIVVASLVPVLWIVFLSLKTPATATDGSFIPHQWTLSNYSDIFKQGIFTDALRNSIGIGLISTVLAVALASSAAYAIARLDFPGKQVILRSRWASRCSRRSRSSARSTTCGARSACTTPGRG